jgi:hypothetical protein
MAATAGLSLTLDPMGKMCQNASSLKPLGQLKQNCPGHLGFPIGIKNRNLVKDIPMIILLQFGFSQFISFREEDLLNFSQSDHIRLTLDPMGKCSNAFFSETTNIIKAKLYVNVHWVVLYKLYVFCSGMKFKMAAFEHFPIGSNVNLCPTVAVILDFRSA